MVTSPTGKGVIAMGGNTASFEYSKAMFELSASMQWTRLDNSPTGKGVIVMGGFSWDKSMCGSSHNPDAVNSKAMFELSQSMELTRLEQTSKIGHLLPLAIPIPDELVYDKIKPISDLSPLSTSLYFLIGGILLALLMLYFTQ